MPTIMQAPKQAHAQEKAKSAIAVMDSGVGGLSILKSLRKHLPNENYFYYADFDGFPYGEKSGQEIRQRLFAITDFFADKNIKALVLACNSATAAAIATLREDYPLRFFGTEPGVKPAAQSSKKGIVVLATNYTLQSEQFNKLVNQYSKGDSVYRVPAPELVKLVEAGDWHSKESETLIRTLLGEAATSVDTLLLGCTHFVFLKAALQKVLGPDVNIIDTTEAITAHVKDSLQKESLLNKQQTMGNLKIFFHGGSEQNKLLVKNILQEEKADYQDIK